jgi:hypothetical protein
MDGLIPSKGLDIMISPLARFRIGVNSPILAQGSRRTTEAVCESRVTVSQAA